MNRLLSKLLPLLMLGSTAAIAEPNLKVVTVKSSYLNVRSGASADYPQLVNGAYLRKGEKFISMNQRGNWHKISFLGFKGWSSEGSRGQFLNVRSIYSMEEGVLKVTERTMALVSSSSSASPVALKKNQYYVFSEDVRYEGRNYLRVKMNGTSYYVSSADVEIIKDMGEYHDDEDDDTTVDPVPECDWDETWDGYECVPTETDPDPTCDWNETWNGYECVPDREQCDSDETWNGYECVPDRPTCDWDETWNGHRCVPDREQCDSDETWNGSRCVPDRPTCDWDEHWDGTRCVPNRGQCDSNETWNGHRCVPDRPTCDADEHWNGSRCVPNSHDPNPERTCPVGKRYDHRLKRCVRV